MTDINRFISSLDNNANFPFKVLESFSKELNNFRKYKNNQNKNNLYLDEIGKNIKEKIDLENWGIKRIKKKLLEKLLVKEEVFLNFLGY